jgi:hypothetical protein
LKFAESLSSLQLSEASPSSRTYDGQMEIMITIGATASGHRLRLALVPLGHLVGCLPIGNTGGANVSAFAPMAIPRDLKRLLQDRDR